MLTILEFALFYKENGREKEGRRELMQGNFKESREGGGGFNERERERGRGVQ